MRKLSIIAVCALIFVSVFALSLSAERTLPLVVDNAELLTREEAASLNEKLDTLSSKLQFELAVVTVSSTDGKDVIAYADDFYDYNGYGYGENDDGALLLIDMGERAWYITTHGTGEVLLDYNTLGYIENSVSPCLSSGDFYEAFVSFAEECEYYILNPIAHTQSGNSGYYDDDYGYDYGYDYDEADEKWSFTEFIIPSLIIGFIIAIIMVSVMRSGMKTVRSAKDAASYMVDGSLKLNVSRDTYLYRTVTRTRKAEHHSSGGGGRGGFGGGHVSRGGRSHGGRGGRF